MKSQIPESGVTRVDGGYAVSIPVKFEELWGLEDDEMVTWESPNSIFGVKKSKLLQYEGESIREKILSLLEKEPIKPLLTFYS